jgi:hypothetical protein
MKRKVLSIALMLVLMFGLTGCMKISNEVEIKDNKKMTVTLLYAMQVDEEEIKKKEEEEAKIEKMLPEEYEEYLEKLEKRNIQINEYSEEGWRGYEFVKTVDNIDEISSELDDITNDLSALFSDNPKLLYYFKLKRGFFTNTYEASFLPSGSEGFSDMETPIGGDSAFGTDSMTTPDETQIGTEDLGSMVEGLEELSKDVEYKWVVKLPRPAISNNADEVSTDGKTLTWDLIKNNKERNIEFKFELLNLSHIISVSVVAGAILLMFISSFINLNKKRTKKEVVYSTKNVESKDIGEVDETGTSMNNEMNSDLSI